MTFIPISTIIKTLRKYPNAGIFFTPKMMKLSRKINKYFVSGMLAAGLFLNSTTVATIEALENRKNEIVISTTKLTVVATAYSSTEAQTDSTPFITASNKQVFDGLIAANFLKFGTKVKITGLYGNKIFTVEDRMNKRYNKSIPPRIDVWFPTYAEAKKFGVKKVEIEILNPPFSSGV